MTCSFETGPFAVGVTFSVFVPNGSWTVYFIVCRKLTHSALRKKTRWLSAGQVRTFGSNFGSRPPGAIASSLSVASVLGGTFVQSIS